MSISKPSSRIRTALAFSLAISSCILISRTDSISRWLGFPSAWIVPVIGASAIVIFLLIFALRATLLTWITVLVLLAFAGNRRRSLVQRGRAITADVAMNLVSFAIRESRIVAFVFATIVSLFAAFARTKDAE